MYFIKVLKCCVILFYTYIILISIFYYKKSDKIEPNEPNYLFTTVLYH